MQMGTTVIPRYYRGNGDIVGLKYCGNCEDGD